MPEFRIGLGHDIHRFEEGRPLVLGGVKIDFPKGLAGHSDADALIHAIMDAMLGALALDDIGTHFPDTDPAYKGISSLELLKKVAILIKKKGYETVNIDSTIRTEKPKIMPHREKMKAKLAEALSLSPDRISIKAGTNEGMDSIGAGLAIECEAVVLLRKLTKN